MSKPRRRAPCRAFKVATHSAEKWPRSGWGRQRDGAVRTRVRTSVHTRALRSTRVRVGRLTSRFLRTKYARVWMRMWWNFRVALVII